MHEAWEVSCRAWSRIEDGTCRDVPVRQGSTVQIEMMARYIQVLIVDPHRVKTISWASKTILEIRQVRHMKWHMKAYERSICPSAEDLGPSHRAKIRRPARRDTDRY